MMTLFRLVLLWATLLLAACGGGGGAAGDSQFVPSNPTPTPTAAALELVLSANIIANTTDSSITATAIAVDANGVVVSGVPVSFTVDNGGLATPSGTTTNAQGKVIATIGIGSDTSPRTITVSAVSGTLKRTAQLQVQEGATAGSTPTLTMALSSTSISSANPATVTATLRDAKSEPLAGQVVTFFVVRGLAVTNVATSLTRSDGTAVAVLSPASSTGAGADEVRASAVVSGSTLTALAGFTVQATNVSISSFSSAVPTLGAYGQTSLSLTLVGATIGSPVQVTVSSACVTAGKAALSPSKFTATTSTVTLQYRDIGCGAVRVSDSLQAVIDGSGSVTSLSLPIQAPAVASLAFISSTPETIFLKGSGFTESSSIIFEVRDANSSPLPNVNVSLRLLTLTGGVTMDGGTADVERASDGQGRVTVRVNSGTLPTPVRVAATIVGTSISTVSSNLSVAVGLPSQLNFSLSQGTRNIEGYDIDGTANTYQIIAADRNGNPVPAGTSINFIAEGGQVEAIKQTQIADGIARTTARFVSSEPRPVDGRVTISAYALGEESFIDLNGNNAHDSGEPFQDLGNIFKDRNFDGLFDSIIDEYIPLAINNAAACVTPASPLLLLNPSIPSMSRANGHSADTCDNRWSGAGQVYVRRAAETVLSTSSARPLWANTSGLESGCKKLDMQIGPQASNTARFTVVSSSDTWFTDIAGPTFNLIVADANPGSLALGLLPRLNPMAAGTTISATGSVGIAARVAGGSPVPNSSEVTTASVTVGYGDGVFEGTVFVTFTSPSGLGTTYPVSVARGRSPTSNCPTP